MAEQNRKTPEQKVWRNRAKDAVDLYIEVLYTEAKHWDIGRESRSVIGMTVDFLGEIPRGSGFIGFCKLGAKIDRMARDVLTQDHHNAADWIKRLSHDQRGALVYERALRGRNKVVAVDPLKPDQPVTKLWTDEECARDLECSADVFRRRISDGYSELERLMGFRCQEAA